MKPNEFNEKLRALVQEQIVGQFADLKPLTDIKELSEKYGFSLNPFHYASWTEMNFERNLREDYERKTTFTSDFSLAEWCYPLVRGAILDTFTNAIKNYKNDIEYFAELIMAVNMKSWEMAARRNKEWSAMYAELYYIAKELYFDWFDKTHAEHDEAMRYYFDYVD